MVAAFTLPVACFLRRSNRVLMSTAPATSSQQDVQNIRINLAAIRARISAAAAKTGTAQPDEVKLIAVSKTKPVDMLRAAQEAGQIDFGENYVQELKEKSEMITDGVRWHFIGNLQTNKANTLLSVPNLSSVHSVDRVKLALALHRAAERVERPQLDVFVQVNVDEEATKSGCSVEEVDEVVDAVRECERLRFVGLMCIGRPGNLDAFRKLSTQRDRIAPRLGIDKTALQLSMGMSADFEQAVEMGSNVVRVGSSIFGARVYPKA